MKKKIKCVDANGTSLMEGKVYESEVENIDYFYINMGGTLTAFSKNRFVEIMEEPNILDEIRKEMEEAKKLIGKTVIYNDSLKFKYKVYSVNFFIKDISTQPISMSVREVAKKKGYCVYVASEGERKLNPYNEVEVVQDSIDVFLNSQYTAKVYKDKVVVGCQTFTIEQVKSIVDASNKLKQPINP